MRKIEMKKAMGLVLGAAIMAAPASLAWAATLDSSFDAMSKSGTHQFYVWCTGGESRVESAQGANAREAQAKLASTAGDKCWPVWQGLAN